MVRARQISNITMTVTWIWALHDAMPRNTNLHVIYWAFVNHDHWTGIQRQSTTKIIILTAKYKKSYPCDYKFVIQSFFTLKYATSYQVVFQTCLNTITKLIPITHDKETNQTLWIEKLQRQEIHLFTLGLYWFLANICIIIFILKCKHECLCEICSFDRPNKYRNQCKFDTRYSTTHSGRHLFPMYWLSLTLHLYVCYHWVWPVPMIPNKSPIHYQVLLLM